jgi:hypothetical protein
LKPGYFLDAFQYFYDDRFHHAKLAGVEVAICASIVGFYKSM